MRSVNRATLLGNLGSDPEVIHTKSGQPIVKFSVATSRAWTDRDSGQRKENTEWHRIVVMDAQIGEFAQKYLHKGSQVYVEGEMQTRSWEDQAGTRRYMTEVYVNKFRGELVSLDRKEAGAEEAVGDPRPQPVGFDSDVPF